MIALLRVVSHHSWFRIAVCDAYHQRLQYEFHAHTKGYALSNDYLKSRESTRRASNKMYLTLCHTSDIRDLSAEQLQYIPKIVWYSYVCTAITSNTWRQIRRFEPIVNTCDEHYNQPAQRTHIDGSASKIKDCNQCWCRAVVCWIER